MKHIVKNQEPQQFSDWKMNDKCDDYQQAWA